MQTSDQIDKIAEALCQARPQFKEIYKTKEVTVKHKNGGNSYKFSFAPFPEIIEATEVALNQSGLSVVQSDVEGRLVSRLIHISGQWIQNQVNVEYDGKGSQQYGAALTFARRYGYMELLGICPEDDDENRLGDNPDTQVENKYPPRNSKDPNWQGPMSKGQLVDTSKDYAEQFSSATAVEDLEVIKESPEFVEFVAQCKHDYPGLLTGQKFFGEWQTGLQDDYKQRLKELKACEDLEPRK